jgi:chromosome segregation ATPase
MANHSKITNRRKSVLNIFIFLVLITVWAGSIYYGYFYVKDYIDVKLNTVVEKIETVKETNTGNFDIVNNQIKNLNDDINNLKAEIISLQDNINDLNETLESIESLTEDNAVIKETLSKKIKLLSAKIELLNKNIQILQEAPNVKN